VSYSSLFARIVAVIGITIYGSVLYLTFSVPGLLGDLARKAFKANEEKLGVVKEQLRLRAHESMASALAEIRNLDCECRAKYAERLKRGFEFKISALQTANDQIVSTIQRGYMGVVADLKKDVRIFLISNVAIFVLLLLVSFLKPTARLHLMIPAVLLTFATLVCSYFYVFEQNWLLTIIHSDYVGFGYLAYLAIVVLFLADILFNKGRVTVEILNQFFSAIGSALSAGPC